MESVFYVLIYLCLLLEKPGKRHIGFFLMKGWDSKTTDPNQLRRIGAEKRHVMTNDSEFKERILDCLAPYFQPLRDYLQALRQFIFAPARSKENPKSIYDKAHKDREFKEKLKEIERIHDEITRKLAEGATTYP